MWYENHSGCDSLSPVDRRFRPDVAGARRRQPCPQTDSRLPDDIPQIGGNEHHIALAVAGFSQDELTVPPEQTMLVVAGERAGENKGEYLHGGIPDAPSGAGSSGRPYEGRGREP